MNIYGKTDSIFHDLLIPSWSDLSNKYIYNIAFFPWLYLSFWIKCCVLRKQELVTSLKLTPFVIFEEFTVFIYDFITRTQTMIWFNVSATHLHIILSKCHSNIHNLCSYTINISMYKTKMQWITLLSIVINKMNGV